jgi:hypothetical protein
MRTFIHHACFPPANTQSGIDRLGSQRTGGLSAIELGGHAGPLIERAGGIRKSRWNSSAHGAWSETIAVTSPMRMDGIVDHQLNVGRHKWIKLESGIESTVDQT